MAFSLLFQKNKCDLHRWAVSDLLVRVRINNIMQVDICCSPRSACTVEFYISASECWIGPGFHRSCRNMTAEPSVSLLFQVGCRSSWVCLEHPHLSPCNEISCLESCTDRPMMMVESVHPNRPFWLHRRLSCLDRFAGSALGSVGLMNSSHLNPWGRLVRRPMAAVEPSCYPSLSAVLSCPPFLKSFVKIIK